MTQDELAGLFGFFEAECRGCDIFSRVNDLGLCEECAGKLERDLIRERNWDYTVSACGLTDSRREELRSQVVAQYGEKLELIAPKKSAERKGKARKRRKKRSRKRR
jgi:hypothetical protein